MLFDESRDTGTGGMLQEARPVMPVAAVLFGQRAPGGEVVERAALTVAEGGVGQLAARRPRHLVQQFECRSLSRPCAVPVDGVELGGALLDLGPQPPHPAALGQVGEFGDRLDAKIKRIDEAPRCRQIRRRLHGDRRCGRVQRIDQHIVSAMPGCRPYRQVGQVGEIADTPRLPGPHAVELSGQAPGAAGAELLRQPSQSGVTISAVLVCESPERRCDAVVAQR